MGLERLKKLGGLEGRRFFACNRRIEASFIRRLGAKKPVLAHRLFQSLAERLTLEPNQRNSLKFNAPRGLQFTLGSQFGYRDLRGIFAKMHRNSLGFTAILEFLKSAGFEPKPS